MAYLPRIYDGLLSEQLQTIGAVLIEGPKWSGKATTAREHARSALELQDVRRRKQIESALEVDPTSLLRGATPRLIDEWQMASILWDAVRQEVDRRQDVGQFILTGSSSIDYSKIIISVRLKTLETRNTRAVRYPHYYLTDCLDMFVLFFSAVHDTE